MKKLIYINLFFVVLLFTHSLNAQLNYSVKRAYRDNINSNAPSSQEGRAINNNGIMLGAYQNLSLGIYDGYTYPPPSILGNISGNGSYIAVADLNDNNVKVGGCQYNSRDFVPCRWIENNTSAYRTGFTNGYVNGFSNSVNNNGKIVGTFKRGGYQTTEVPDAGFFWDEQNGITLIGTLGNGYSRANSINNYDQVVGESDDQAFLWDAQNGIRSLNNVIGNNTGWTFKKAKKINNNGNIIGVGTFNNASRNFYWDGNLVYDLGQSSDDVVSAFYEIKGLNDLGQITGHFYDSDNFSENYIFVWDKVNGFQNLSSVVSVTNWTWTDAVDINNNGQILVNGNNTSLQIIRAWIFTPKEIEPLIFIPGVAGSTLFTADINNDPIEDVWPSGIKSFTNNKLLTLSLDPNDTQSSIVAVDAFRELSTLPPFPTYKIYKPLLDHLKDKGYVEYEINGNPKKRHSACTGTETYNGKKPTLFIFAYDWRLSNFDAAQELKKFVDCVGKFHSGKKPNMLTHSMGGLIARRYILNNPGQHNINRLITMVPPFLGAPKAINALYTGRFIGTDFILGFSDQGTGFYVGEKAVRKIMTYSKGAHELLPTSWYFTLSDTPPLADRWLSFYDYEKAKKLINNKFPSKPYDNSAAFHEGSNIDQDNWSLDNSGVKYYHIYAQQKYNKTPIQTILKPFSFLSIDKEEYKYGVKTVYGLGDGTVPSVSARRAPYLLAPNTVLKRCQSNSWIDDGDYQHNGVTKNPIIWREVLAFLSDEDNGECVTESSNNSSFVQYQTKEEKQDSSNDSLDNLSQEGDIITLKAYGTERLKINDEFGNTNSPLSDGVEQQVPGVLYEDGTAYSSQLLVPHELNFAANKILKVNFVVPPNKTRIEIMRGKLRYDNNLLIKYMDLDLLAGVNVLLEFTVNGIENLKYDSNDDGIFDTEIQPDYNLQGTSANDETDPILEANYTVVDGVATVNISASDNETGIKQVRYFFNGEPNFHIYASPFTVNLSESKLLFITAEDNVGNRSVITKWLDVTKPITSITQTPPSNGAGWNISNVTVTLKSIDDIGGSGIKSLTYSSDGSQPIAEVSLYNEIDPFVLPVPSNQNDFLSKTLNFYTEGVNTLNFFSMDKEDNTEIPKTYTIKIDKGLPITRHNLSSDGQQTTITLNATDAISGVNVTLYSIDGGAMQNYSVPFIVSNTGGHYIKYFSKDVAGNEEGLRTIHINPNSVAKSILISEFRTRGYNGADDEFIELYNNGDTAVDISGWMIKTKQGSITTSTLLATINNGVIIPARGHYLLGKAGINNYSLSAYAEPDQTYSESLADNSGIALFSTSSILVDAVGFSSVTDASYREGTGLTPSTGIITNGQYSFVRNFTGAKTPVDSDNNRVDFIFISTDGGTYNNLKSLLGSPGPENLSSPIYREGDILISQIDSMVTLAEAPNRIYNYTETDPLYPIGVISLRRKLTNNSGLTVSKLRVRITALTTKNSAKIFTQQAVLRILNSSDLIVTSANGQTNIPLKGIRVEPDPNTTDGGINSSLLIDLGSNGLNPEESVNINLKLGIVTNGQYKLEFSAESVF